MAMSAYAFSADTQFEAMQKILEDGTGWTWRPGDSAWLGDYLAASTDATGGSLRLYKENGRFVIEMRRSALNDAMRNFILDKLLPLLAARGIVADEGCD